MSGYSDLWVSFVGLLIFSHALYPHSDPGAAELLARLLTRHTVHGDVRRRTTGGMAGARPGTAGYGEIDSAYGEVCRGGAGRCGVRDFTGHGQESRLPET